jgi:hypothetical protein
MRLPALAGNLVPECTRGVIKVNANHVEGRNIVKIVGRTCHDSQKFNPSDPRLFEYEPT